MLGQALFVLEFLLLISNIFLSNQGFSLVGIFFSFFFIATVNLKKKITSSSSSSFSPIQPTLTLFAADIHRCTHRRTHMHKNLSSYKDKHVLFFSSFFSIFKKSKVQHMSTNVCRCLINKLRRKFWGRQKKSKKKKKTAREITEHHFHYDLLLLSGVNWITLTGFFFI